MTSMKAASSSSCVNGVMCTVNTSYNYKHSFDRDLIPQSGGGQWQWHIRQRYCHVDIEAKAEVVCVFVFNFSHV